MIVKLHKDKREAEEGKANWEREERRKLEEEKRRVEEEKGRMEEEKRKVEEEKINLAKERQRIREVGDKERRRMREESERERQRIKEESEEARLRGLPAFLLNPPREFIEGPAVVEVPKVGAAGEGAVPFRKGAPPFPAPGQGRQSRENKRVVRTIDLPIVATGVQYRQPPGSQEGLPSDYGFRCPITRPAWKIPAWQDASKDGANWGDYGDGLRPWGEYGNDLNVRLKGLQDKISETISEKRKFEEVYEGSSKRQKLQENASTGSSIPQCGRERKKRRGRSRVS